MQIENKNLKEWLNTATDDQLGKLYEQLCTEMEQRDLLDDTEEEEEQEEDIEEE